MILLVKGYLDYIWQVVGIIDHTISCDWSHDIIWSSVKMYRDVLFFPVDEQDHLLSGQENLFFFS